MAHELATTADGRAAIAYVGETPWHKLGQKIAADAPVGDWIKAAGLDWTVSAQPLYLANGKEVESFRALQRDDNGTVLDVVGADWEPIQNYQAFEFFERFAKAGAITLETAGALRGGRDVWVLGRVSDAFELPGGDEVCSYVLFDNPHQRGRAALIIPTPIRVVCANTQGWALQKHEGQQRKLEARFTHVGESRFSVDRALDQLGIIGANFRAFEEAARRLAAIRCKAIEFESYVRAVYNLTEAPAEADDKAKEHRRAHNQRVIDGLKTVRETQPGAGLSEGSWWSAYNAVTFDVDHSPRRNVSADAALGSAWLGAGKDRKARALHMALALSE